MKDAETMAEATRGRMRETRTPDGIRILTEAIPSVRSVAVGVWVRHGAAHDPAKLPGASHLLEHMVFKGTESRGPREIVMALERLGGALDAFTSREHTAYQARVLSSHLPEALDILSDLVRHPLLRAEDLELERRVVLEEIATVEDTPDDLVFELHARELWEGHPYGRPILGTREALEAVTADQLRQLHRDRYLEGQLVVAAAGYLDHDDVVEMVRERFRGVGGGSPSRVPEPTEPGGGREHRVHRDSAQTHIVVGSRTPPRADPVRFPLVLLSAAFGGGMGSRLFQKIREELALAYTVYAFQSFHKRGGASGVYLGTGPESADLAVAAVLEEYAKLAHDGLTAEELREVKDQVKGQVMLSLESTSSRLFRLAGFALYDQAYLTLDELLEKLERVTVDQVAEAAERYFDPDAQLIVRLGPAGGSHAGPAVGPRP